MDGDAHTITTKIEFKGGSKYVDEVEVICESVRNLKEIAEVANKSVARLNESLKEFIKLRDVSG